MLKMDLGSSPIEEDCAQVGEENYHSRAAKECEAYIGQLRRHLFANGQVLVVGLRVARNAHDFGSYLSVVAEYDPEAEGEQDQAYWLEANQPTEWDEEAKAELGLLYTELIWKCDKCGDECRANDNGDRQVEGESDHDDLFEDELAVTVDGESYCTPCVEKYTSECSECGERYSNEDGSGYPHPDPNNYRDGVCGEDCYCEAERKYGEDCWTNFGEGDCKAFLEELCGGDEVIAEEIWKDGGQEILAMFYSCSKGYHDDFCAPRDLDDIAKVLSREEADQLEGMLPSECPSCKRPMPRLWRMTDEGLQDFAPTARDDKSWDELRDDHEEDCAWWLTRGQRTVQVAPPAEHACIDCRGPLTRLMFMGAQHDGYTCPACKIAYDLEGKPMAKIF